MKRHAYDPECPHCVPALVVPATGKPLPPDDPFMVEVMRLWWLQPLSVRAAFIEVTCNNSRVPAVMSLANVFIDALKSINEVKSITPGQ